jgi:hypothetical protein
VRQLIKNNMIIFLHKTFDNAKASHPPSREKDDVWHIPELFQLIYQLVVVFVSTKGQRRATRVNSIFDSGICSGLF